MILIICYTRKMDRGNANRLYIAVVSLSLFTAIADLGMEVTSNMAPLTEAQRVVCCVSTYLYLALRNANNLVLLLFLLTLTRTTFLIRKRSTQIVLLLPYLCILFVLLQNPFTHNTFTITAEAGYARGPWMAAIYGIALIYGIIGLVYCVYCRRFLPKYKWIALLSVYVLAHLAVLIQLFHHELLLEMFFTALGELLILFSIMRPEERMDSEVGMQSWFSYQTDLNNIIHTGEAVQIVIIQILNCREIRNFLGDHRYNAYLSEIATGIRAFPWRHPHQVELYYERPGTIYLITGPDETDAEHIRENLMYGAADSLKQYSEMGVRPETQVCLIHCPKDLDNVKDIISLGHRFPKIGSRKQHTFHASDIVNSRDFAIE